MLNLFTKNDKYIHFEKTNRNTFSDSWSTV